MIEAAPVDGFKMYGVREVLATFYSESRILNMQVETLERALREQNAGLAFDLARTLVESVCKTILLDGGETDAAVDRLGMKDLFNRAMRTLRLPQGDVATAKRVHKALESMVAGIGEVVLGISELRYLEGFASHGSHAYAIPPEVTHAQFAARCADAVVSFMIGVHKSSGQQAAANESGLDSDDSTAFNQWVDESNDPVRIFDLTYQPSEVLFRVDPEAYRAALLDYEAQGSSPDELTEARADA
jgi:Abortive infection C-terminus